MSQMSSLYYEALDKYSEISVYLKDLNERLEYLFARSTSLEIRCNDLSVAQELKDMKAELARIRGEIPVIILLNNQISDILSQFFKEYHFSDEPKRAEVDYITFINSSTYKAAMGGYTKRL